jgi:regulatory protein
LEKSKSKERALQLAYRYLARQAKTVYQVEGYLNKKRIAGDIISDVLEDLKKKNLLNDLEYAISYIDENKRKYGRIMLKKRLRKLKVDEEYINTTIGNLSRDEEHEIANDLIIKKKTEYLRLLPEKASRRCYNFLISRGFSNSIAVKLSFEVLNEAKEKINR